MMKHLKFVMIASIMAIIFNGSAYAQLPDWLDGKWLANTVYEIKGDTIKKVEDGITVNLGEFTINEDSLIIIDGKESDLIVLNADKALAYKTNPNFKFPKYDNLTLPEKYKWVAGSWTDGESIITFGEKDVTIKQDEYVVNSGIYYVDDSGSFNVFWDKNGQEDYFIINGDVVAYEGGDNLYKLPEQQQTEQSEQSEASDNNPLLSLNTSSKPYEGDIKWLYGVWTHNGTEIFITPKYYQARRENDTYLADKDLFELDKIQYAVTEEDNQILGKVIRIDDFYLDPTSKLIYTLSNVDKRMYMEKISNYVSPVISYGKWILVGLATIAVLITLSIIVVRFVKKVAKKAKKKAVDAKILAEQKRAKLAEKSKAFNDSLKSKASRFSEGASVLAEQAKNSIKHPTSGILLLYSILVLLFVDYGLGLILSILFLAYILIKKFTPNVAESIISTLNGWREKISSKPLRAHGLVLLLIAYLVWREFSPIAGLLLIIPAVVFLVMVNKRPERLESFDSTVTRLGNIITFSHKDRCLLAFIFILFLLINGIWGFVFALVALSIMILFFIAINSAERYTYIKDRIVNWYSTFSNSKFSYFLGRMWNKKIIRVISKVAAVLVILTSLQQNTGIHQAIYSGVAVASGSYEDIQEDNKHSASNAVLDKLVEGRWRLTINGETQIIDFKSGGAGFGTYTMLFKSNFSMVPSLEIGNYEIADGNIKLRDASDGSSSYIKIEGVRLSDGEGHYYSKSYR